MRKVIRFIIIFVVIASVLTSCSNTRQDGVNALSVYVPAFKSTDLKSGSNCILEEDDFGRILYSFTDNPSFGYNGNDVAVVIMQKADKDFVYYYEDSFFVILQDVSDIESIDVTSTTITALKEQNDWAKEPNTSKMSKREINITFDLYANPEKPEAFTSLEEKYFYNQLKKVFEKEYNYSSGENVEFIDSCFCDYDRKEKILVWVSVKVNENYENYFCIGTTDYTYTFMKIHDIYSYQDDLAKFKKENGWNYSQI